MQAVLINELSLDLIATNNGGVQPEIELGRSGYPTTYFILPSDPNAHAEIVDVRTFFLNYTFVGDEALDEFRPVTKV